MSTSVRVTWIGHICLVTGLALLAIVLSQGVRLDWFHSTLICSALAGGLIATFAGLLGERHHPSPFIRLQLLSPAQPWAWLHPVCWAIDCADVRRSIAAEFSRPSARL